MSRNNPSESLAEKLGITATDLRTRKQLLGINADVEAALARMKPLIEPHIDDVIEEFYDYQLAVPEIRAMIGDKDTLTHLKRAQRRYVLELFCGDYGADYAAKRLRVGRIHGRIGIPSKFYVGAISKLMLVLRNRLTQKDPSLPVHHLKLILLFDLELTFDTYVHGLLGQVDAANEALTTYSHELEELVRERTARIEMLSRTDQVTGLQNRRQFTAALERECASTKRRNAPLTLLFCDLDGFKAINDTEGHATGDAYLAIAGQVLHRVAAAPDLTFRFGGDEFCVLLPDRGEEAAAHLAERLKTELPCATEGKLSFSIGSATSGPNVCHSPEELLRRADQAMYAEKDAGRPQKTRPKKTAV